MSPSDQHLAVTRQYLQALERFAIGDELSRYFTPDVVQQEFPNRLAVQGMTRMLPELLAGAERGKQLLSRQRFEVKSALADGNHVALEILWTGVLAVPVAGLPAGAEMRAHIATFLEFAGRRIKAQRNYDCYEPW
ncbi:MAG: nuclear transport factor 2 family protein [Pirellulales bacterium]